MKAYRTGKATQTGFRLQQSLVFERSRQGAGGLGIPRGMLHVVGFRPGVSQQMDATGRLSREINVNIYVGNLAYSVTEEQLRDAFGQFGEVDKVSIIMDRMTGRSKGFGFVEMQEDSEAEAAIRGLNEQPINGRAVRVNEARPREERPRRPAPPR